MFYPPIFSLINSVSLWSQNEETIQKQYNCDGNVDKYHFRLLLESELQVRYSI